MPESAVLTTIPDAEAKPDSIIEVKVLDRDESNKAPTGLRLVRVIARASGQSLSMVESLSNSDPRVYSSRFHLE